jgi:hypothetical protein
LALKGHITLDTKLVVTVGDLAYLSNTWSLSGTGPDGTPVVLGGHDGRGGAPPGRRHLALCDRQRLGRSGDHRIATGWAADRSVDLVVVRPRSQSGQSGGI